MTNAERKIIDKKNINLYNSDNIDADETAFTCVTCGDSVTISIGFSCRGHNFICPHCLHRIAVKEKYEWDYDLLTKYIHVQENTWDLLPEDILKDLEGESK